MIILKNKINFLFLSSLTGLPASYMTVDQDKLYWTNSTLQTLASIDKKTGENFQIENSDTTVLIATGRHLQPYPGMFSKITVPFCSSRIFMLVFIGLGNQMQFQIISTREFESEIIQNDTCGSLSHEVYVTDI